MKSQICNIVLLTAIQNSPVPVVVVRHPDKRRKKMNKRKNDPNRKGYATILNKSASIPGSEHSTLKGGKIIEAEAGEAEAVAKALGLSSNLASRKVFGFKKEEGDTLTVGENKMAPSVKGEASEQSEAKNGAEANEREDDEKEENEEEAGLGDYEEDEISDEESPSGVMYAESGGIETMRNYVNQPEDVLDDDVERLALSDEEDREIKSRAPA